jgi:hypothetical protein
MHEALADRIRPQDLSMKAPAFFNSLFLGAPFSERREPAPWRPPQLEAPVFARVVAVLRCRASAGASDLRAHRRG